MRRYDVKAFGPHTFHLDGVRVSREDSVSKCTLIEIGVEGVLRKYRNINRKFRKGPITLEVLNACYKNVDVEEC